MLNDCYAFFDDENSRFNIGNSKINKTIVFKGSFMRTESVIDKANFKEWSCRDKLWQRCPLLSADELPKITSNFTEVLNSHGMKPHLKTEITLCGKSATVWYEFIVFPEVPFVFTQCFVEATESAKN